jgi:hypothetical protein
MAVLTRPGPQEPVNPPRVVEGSIGSGTRPRPAWVVAEPVLTIHGPRNIAAMKQQVVDYHRALMRIQRQIDGVEQNLDSLDPAAVVAVQVPNYLDPQERVDAAKAARAATPST